MKSAVVAIVGRPSAGKSTLLNAMCGHKVSIVAAAPQTTRNQIRGIVTEARGQIVFLDTPGFHTSTKKLNLRLSGVVGEALRDVDLVLYVVDSTRAPGEEESAIAGLLHGASDHVIIASTKCDVSVLHAISETAGRFLAERFPGRPVVRVSALTGTGVDELLTAIFERVPEGEALYPEEYYTDQPPEFRIAEIIREQAIQRVREEVPHSLYVEIADLEVVGDHGGDDAALSPDGDRPNDRDPPLAGPGSAGGQRPADAEPATSTEESTDGELWVRAFLIVERDSQKGILVGRGGSVIKEIRIDAQREIEALFPYRVRLDLRVKVNPKWRSQDGLLRKLIY